MAPPPPAASILDVLGNTPVAKLQHVVPKGCADVHVKLEYFSATGSYKDRMAKSMIEEAERSGRLAPNMTVVEATGGSTGSSLAFVCAVKGYSFMALSSNAYANEKLLTMAAFGAQQSRGLSKGDDCFYTDQFSNGDALVGYREIGHELIAQFPDGFDGFCGSFGTGGMVMGVSSVLKPVMPDVRVVLVEPEGSALLAKGQKGAHGVDGISPGFISQHVGKALYDGTQTIKEEEGREICDSPR
ncbi:cysteine synthase [Fusarium agapanthi]|uniref:Cysteine synthase n=1 Tax=Fusarium agapanthi TaxID=1803897 RepID=A0A9P5B472_9HYPO|nr:cysteine synthase [Fusarium agapanthi]